MLHSGLYFTAQNIERARKNRETEPFKSAWTLLDQPSAPSSELDVPDVLWPALRYRFADDSSAAVEAIDALQNGVGLDAGENRFKTLAASVMLAQTFELLRDHPDFAPEAQSRWQGRFAALVSSLSSDAQSVDMQVALPSVWRGDRFVEYIWSGLLNLVAGIVLENDAFREQGAMLFRQIIQFHVRPEGYLPFAVEPPYGEEEGDGGSLQRQLLASAGLVLMAEAAAHVHLDLWGFASRSISAVTAGSYCIYFYYYPEEWRWDTISEEHYNALYKSSGGFLEILNAHARPKNLKMLFDDLRPFYNPFIGGLTTLTHALPPKRGLFG